MLKYKWLGILLVLLMISVVPIKADVDYSYHCGVPEVHNVRFDFDGDRRPEVYQDVRVKDMPSAGLAPGAPLIPHRPVTLLVPQGDDVESVSVEYFSWKQLPGEYLLPPEQKVYPLSRPGEKQPVPPDGKIYRQTERYPAIDFSAPKMFWSKGYRIVTFNTFPVRYIPGERRIEYAADVRIHVRTCPARDTGDRVRCRGLARDAAWIRRKVENPEIVSGYHAEPPKFPSRLDDRDEYLYVIITTSDMESAGGPNNFQDLLAFKRSRGISGTIKLVSEIYSEYSGVDNQQKIRNFCRDAYENWNTEWILLGGDHALVPARGCYATAEGHQDSTIPTDMYYGCLDGPWDYSGNGVYGEMGDGEDGGDVDVFAEMFVGRASVDTSTQLHNFVAKTIAYETGNYEEDWADNALLLGEYLWTDTYGGDYMDELWYGSDACGYTTVGYPDDWDVDHLYARESSWGASTLIPKLNSNNLVWVNHLGHANTDTVMDLYTSDVDDLTNSIPFIVYSQGCYAGAFDTTDCIAEHFSWSEHGAFAVLMNGRYGWGEIGCTDGPSQYFHRQFHDAYFGEGIRELGAMNQDSKEDNVWCLDYKANRWVCYEMNLLGCPQVPINGIVTTRGTVSFDRHHYRDGDTVKVTVKDVDLNVDLETAESIEVPVTCGDDEETLTLVETGTSTSVFQGSISISTGAVVPGNDHLEAMEADELVVTYVDASDGFGGTNIEVTDIAWADFTPPEISSVDVTAVDDTSVRVTWHTSEPAVSRVIYDTQNPPSAYSVVDAALMEDHTVMLSGLEGCTDYWCYVESTDEAGHTVVDDNGGAGYPVTTLVRIYLLQENMDSDPGWTITGGDWAWGQPTGQPSGPKADPESGFDGDNVYGTNLNGAYQTSGSAYHLVTPPIECSAATGTRLTFYRWLDIAESDYDHAAISVSTDGINWTNIYENPPSAFYEYRWTKVTYDISDYADGADQFYVRWSMGPCSGGGAGGWNIDNVEISYAAPCNVPILIHQDHSIDDSMGNNDGHPNPLEAAGMSVSVWNAGIDATNVSAVLTSDYPHITINQPDTTFGDIPSGHTPVSSQTDMVFTPGKSAEDGDMVPFVLEWTANEGSGTVQFKEEIYAPDLNVESVTVVDYLRGDGDGIFDPGETIQLNIRLVNDGRLPCSGIHGVLSSDHSEYIIIDDAEADFPDIDPGSSGECLDACFTVHSLETTPDHLPVTFLLSLDSDTHTDMPEFGMEVTTSTFIRRFAWSLDEDPGWTMEGAWAWGQPLGNDGDPVSGYTGDNVLGYNLSGKYENELSETSLTSSPIDCSNFSEVEVRFMRWLGVESNSYDHARFQVSTDGNDWQTIWENPNESMHDNSWTEQSFDISDYADGESAVYLRWVMGPTDSSVAYCGWNIDDIELWASSNGEFPVLAYDSSNIDDGPGGDGVVNPDETIDLTVSVENVGIAATGVYGYLSTTNEHVTVTTNQANFQDIPAGGTGETVTPFTFQTGTTMEDHENISFTVTWFSDQGNGSFDFSLPVSAPNLSIGSLTILDPPPGGDGDGILDPGETAQLVFTLQNSGHQDAVNISGTLTVDHPEWVTISDGEAAFQDISAGSSGDTLSPYFTVVVSPDVTDPSTVRFTLDISAEHYSTSDDIDAEITTSTFCRRYVWTMDTDPGWTADGSWEWGIPQGNGGDPSGGYTGENVYGYNLNGVYENSLPETYLTTDAIDCSVLTDVEVRFMRWLGVESASWDHAEFRVSNNGTTWTTVWEHTGSSFTDTDWTAQTFDISEVADGSSTVYLRWVMGPTDSSVTYCGWNIDDVEIWGASGSAPPTATPTSPPPTHTPTFTHTPQPTPTHTPTPPPPTPTHTATGVPPTHTPTIAPPTSTPTPPSPQTPTPEPSPGMTLYMSDTDLEAGDDFHLFFDLYNPWVESRDWDVYLLLQVGEDYWCWPSWINISDGLDYQRMTLNTLEIQRIEVLQFQWPSGVGSADGLTFIGAVFEADTWNFVGDVQVVSWRYH